MLIYLNYLITSFINDSTSFCIDGKLSIIHRRKLVPVTWDHFYEVYKYKGNIFDDSFQTSSQFLWLAPGLGRNFIVEIQIIPGVHHCRKLSGSLLELGSLSRRSNASRQRVGLRDLRHESFSIYKQDLIKFTFTQPLAPFIFRLVVAFWAPMMTFW